ncbi:hypothetical protein I302_101040 [Kwoniella bestiolae CBS 10118]|uniref:RNase III domain-containing protein n=1 Tax=Kwoniella bestiolae CBS 10118 TaxID=1296100 RepID=A0A1B9G6S0_9TREE|nr:hypothetical protein I302_04416 [Kwoniella bestiolae CBS 10118]OCF26729.1 hypothetical protein I302_04416 [Kwoniella bestiolae CBS 10118]
MINDDTPTSALVLLDDNYTCPPLPPITDPRLEQTVFTHRSLVNTLPVAMRGDMESYDKLAHVGDSLLNTFITCLLHGLNPNSRPKVATDLRAKLINREINSHVSRAYSLPSRVRTGLAAGGTFRESDDEAGEVFEAYLAGLFYSYLGATSTDPTGKDKNNGNTSIPPKPKEEIEITSYGQAFDRLSSFLTPLYSPLIKGLYSSSLDYRASLIELSEGAKSELNTLTQKLRSPQPEYEHEHVWPDWVMDKDRKGNQGKVWKSFCTVHLRGGGSITREGMAEGAKGPADNLAAYLVLQDLRGGGSRF